ncbi:HAD-IA family hydrolase [Candidatus Daviesbacteria bacterium]|nr:HAD-IA family hydrolase [Candidatus Daviesbacteria bacterium]
MIKTILFDFSRVILLPKDENYLGGLNDLHKKLKSALGYSLIDYLYLNEPLLKKLKNFKDKFNLCIFTTGTIQNEKPLREILDKIFLDIFTVSNIGPKTDPNSYLKIAGIINAPPEEILFIDDQLKNTKAAKEAGLQTIHFQSNDQLFKDLDLLDDGI